MPVQGIAGSFVVKMVGSYSNVVGLPLYESCTLLGGEGFPIRFGWLQRRRHRRVAPVVRVDCSHVGQAGQNQRCKTHARSAASPRPAASKPFCSDRCKDVDLNRWLSGSYAIPSRDGDEEDPE
jgi:endogenous inhibitor of DNA gyrase (YacG/DUF329 family)